LSIPSDLVLTQSTHGLYQTVRLAVIRICVFWALLLPILPLVAFELLTMVPRLLPTTAFASLHDWAVHGPIVALWVAVVLLLGSLMQFLVLRHSARYLDRLIGVYLALTVCILGLWFVFEMLIVALGRFESIAASALAALILLATAYALWRATLHPPADFIETITEQPR